MGLTDDELAFYDALAMNESAVKAMGNDELKVIGAELVANVRKSVTIAWTVRESTRARIRVMVRRILKKHGYRRTCMKRRPALCSNKPKPIVLTGRRDGGVSRIYLSHVGPLDSRAQPSEPLTPFFPAIRRRRLGG
jgi:hypothetical protein